MWLAILDFILVVWWGGDSIASAFNGKKEHCADKALIAFLFLLLGIGNIMESKPRHYRAREVTEYHVTPVTTIEGTDTTTTYILTYTGIKE